MVRKRWLAAAVLFVFSTSCATTGVSTNQTLRRSPGDPSSRVASSAAAVIGVTGVQVRADGPDGISIIVTADAALVDYTSFAEHAPPRLVIDLPHARNAISRPVTLAAGSPVLRVETMELQQSPFPILRLMFDFNRLLPYRVELTRNGLQILVSQEVSEHAPIAQEPTQLEQAAEPVVRPVEPMTKGSVQAEQPPVVLPPAPKEETLSPKPAALPTAANRPSREATGKPGQGTPPPPTIAAANKRLSMDFKGADLDDLLRLISEVSGLNIVVAHGLKDRKDRDVTVRLNNVEWRQALDVILRAKSLSYEQDGNLIYVGSKGEIQKSKEDRAKDIETAALKDLRIDEEKRKGEEAKRKVEEERRKAEEEERRYAEEPPCTKVIRLAYTKALDVKRHLERLKTRRGSIELEATTNTLIVNDVQSVCTKMAALAKELDAPPKDPFVTKLLPFNYAKATDLKTHLTALRTKEGSVIVDERSSRIIVKDLPEAVERIEAFLKQIDIPTPQVLIEARIVEATRQFSQSLGIQWGGTGIPTRAGSTTGVTAFGGTSSSSGSSSSGGTSSSSGSSSSGGTSLPIQFPNFTSPTGNPFPVTGGGVPFLGPVPLAVNLPVTSPAFALGMTIGSLANRFLVGAQLSAAENNGKIRTLSSPRVATQDNEEAEIKQGTQVPYTTIDSSGRTVVQFQNAFISLKVKPHITPDGRVAMKVEAERSFPGQRVDFSQGFVFPINTRKATTNIMVQNGSTVVIGGLLQSTEATTTDQVPALGDIPILGWLFKRRSIGPDERVELLIFLTPSVLQESRL
ncbi:MAG: type IV pilus secretin PilQ [candidate division NC10 bacterium]|nr:type IV pilus secretin PilQ [candidate division NC10 bacterium]MDE2322115.1 type IV pilus secretin PilQ [candidate division NC10 bacterium]